MDSYDENKKLQHFIDEEKNNTNLKQSHLATIKTHHNQFYDQEFQSSPTKPHNNNPTSNICSPWTRSPLRTPSPSLIYHCITSLRRQDGTIHSIALSSGLVFTGSDSNKVRVWKQPDCVEQGFMKAGYGGVKSVSVYGNMIFTSHKDFKIRIWRFEGLDTFKSKQIGSLPPRRSPIHLPYTFAKKFISWGRQEQHKDCVSCIAYNHAEGLLYTCSSDKTVKVWKVSNNRCADSFLAHKDHVNAIIVNQEDGCVYTCSSDGSIKIWRRVYNANSHTLTMTLKFQKSPVNALALVSSNDATTLYSGSSDGFVNFWEKDRTYGRFNHRGCLQGHRSAVLCLATATNLIFSGSEDSTIRVWRRQEDSCVHECLAILSGHQGPVKCIAACLEVEKIVNGFLVFSASLDQSFKVWRLKAMPEENQRGHDSTDGRSDLSTNRTAKMDCETMNPVLSPSWVERKS